MVLFTVGDKVQALDGQSGVWLSGVILEFLQKDEVKIAFDGFKKSMRDWNVQSCKVYVYMYDNNIP